MTKQPELQGLSQDEFNNLMDRLEYFSPEWANHVKNNNNENSVTIDDLYQKLTDYDGQDQDEIWDKLYEHMYIPETFQTENGDTYEIANGETCVVGEAHCVSDKYLYNTTDKYGTSKDRCYKCEIYSCSLIENNLAEEINLGILNLAKTKEFVKHMEEDHNE